MMVNALTPIQFGTRFVIKGPEDNMGAFGMQGLLKAALKRRGIQIIEQNLRSSNGSNIFSFSTPTDTFKGRQTELMAATEALAQGSYSLSLRENRIQVDQSGIDPETHPSPSKHDLFRVTLTSPSPSDKGNLTNYIKSVL